LSYQRYHTPKKKSRKKGNEREGRKGGLRRSRREIELEGRTEKGRRKEEKFVKEREGRRGEKGKGDGRKEGERRGKKREEWERRKKKDEGAKRKG